MPNKRSIEGSNLVETQKRAYCDKVLTQNTKESNIDNHLFVCVCGFLEGLKENGEVSVQR